MAYPWHRTELEALLANRERLPHALLLRGPQGIGKLAFAESLAQGLLCEDPGAQGMACGQCTACNWVGQGSHPDLRRLEPDSLARPVEGEAETEKKEKASSQIPVEAVRAIAGFINVTTHRGGMKVVLVHPAEALNVNAANALLKNLEEPPPHTCFVLVSHRWHQLLPTLKSRCRQVALRPPTSGTALKWLAGEGIARPELALAYSGGAPLLAAGFDDEYWQRREGFLKALADREMSPMALAEKLGDLAPAVVVSWLQKWAYDILSQKQSGAISYNPDFAAALRAVAGRVNAVEAARFLRRMVRLQRIVSHPLNARLFFEDLLLSYAAFVKGRPVEMAA
jgi:DNA polymerase-3 subunit delta'